MIQVAQPSKGQGQFYLPGFLAQGLPKDPPHSQTSENPRVVGWVLSFHPHAEAGVQQAGFGHLLATWSRPVSKFPSLRGRATGHGCSHKVPGHHALCHMAARKQLHCVSR